MSQFNASASTSDNTKSSYLHDRRSRATMRVFEPTSPASGNHSCGHVDNTTQISSNASQTLRRSQSGSLRHANGRSSNLRPVAPSPRTAPTPIVRPSNLSYASPESRSELSASEPIADNRSDRRLTASLDSGMAAVQRWIRSRSRGSNLTRTSTSSHQYEQDGINRQRPLHSDLNDAAAMPGEFRDCTDNVTTLPQHQPIQHASSPTTAQQPGSPVDSRGNGFLSLRQRALSEPDAVRIRDLLFQRALSGPNRFRRRRYPPPTVVGHNSPRDNSIELVASPGTSPTSSQFATSLPETFYNSTGSRQSSTTNHNIQGDQVIQDRIAINQNTGTNENTDQQDVSLIDAAGGTDSDPDRAARNRWICINRRFQVVITLVALVFSLLLFAILVCWVVLTSAYVVSIEKPCDVPLKYYFWLVTLQLILDVFRTDIMRLFFRWDANSNQRIPCRVIAYNVAYVTFALLVLRMGIYSVFINHGTTCKRTAPELFQSSAAFVSLSIAAWSTIVLGYLVPFCCVAALLTLNGYSPSTDNHRNDTPTHFTVFPTAMGAPAGCVNQLRVVSLDDFPADYPMECCICMENFNGTETIVETECNHVFHKQCCRVWLRQARTCPVCRTDIPTSLENTEQRSTGQQNNSGRLGFGPASRRFARNDLHHEVVSLIQILRRRDRRRQRVLSGVSRRSEGNLTTEQNSIHQLSSRMEEGRRLRRYSQS